MRSKLDPDDESLIPERPIDWSGAKPSPFIRKPGEKTEIFIDGAVGYRLRLIPSNKVLAEFDSTLAAWPVIIAIIEGGRSPRTLALDALFVDGKVGLVSAGPRLGTWARSNNGEPLPYGDVGTAAPRRVAEGVA